MCNFNNYRFIRESKKEHSCYLCGEKIEKGSSYHKLVGVGDDGFYEIKLHQGCYRVVNDYCANDYYGEGWDDECVMEYVNEFLKEEGLEIPKFRREAIELFLGLIE